MGLIGILMLLVLLPIITHAGDTLYVQSTKAKIMSAPSFQSDIVEVIPKGTAVESIESQTRWIKVSYQKYTGWISNLLVLPEPPLKKTSLLDQGPAIQDSRRRASNVASSAAARGLNAEDRARINMKNKFDYAALSQMESLKIDDSEVWQFLQEGRDQ